MKKILFSIFHLCSLIFFVANLLYFVKQANSVPGDIKFQRTGPTLAIAVTVAANGSLAASTTYYLRFAAYDSGGAALLMSPIATCTTDSTNKTCSLTWQAVAGVNNYKVFYSTTKSDLTGGTLSINYKQPSPVTTASLTMSDTTATGTAAVPAESTDFLLNKFSGTGNFWTVSAGQNFGIGVQNPTNTLEMGGNVKLNGSSTVINSGEPTTANDFATKKYVNDTVTARCSIP